MDILSFVKPYYELYLVVKKVDIKRNKLNFKERAVKIKMNAEGKDPMFFINKIKDIAFCKFSSFYI